MQTALERGTCSFIAFVLVMALAPGCAEKRETVTVTPTPSPTPTPTPTRPPTTTPPSTNVPPPVPRADSQDHPLLKRYEGAILVANDHRNYDSYTVPLGEVVATPDFKRSVFSKSFQLEGDVTRLTYAIPEGRSTLEVLRNYERELNQEGYTLLYAADGDEASKMWFVDIHQFDHADLGMGGRYRIRVWKQLRREGDVYIVLYAMNAAFPNDVQFKPGVNQGQTILYAHVIVNKPMETNK